METNEEKIKRLNKMCTFNMQITGPKSQYLLYCDMKNCGYLAEIEITMNNKLNVPLRLCSNHQQELINVLTIK